MFKSTLKKIYSREMFSPSLLGVFINPFYIIRKKLHEKIMIKSSYLSGKLLDFGCGRKPYENIFDVEEYTGLDIQESGHDHTNEQIDVYYDGETIPFDDNTFDSIFSSEVLEHVFNPEQILSEIFRVLKPGGHILLTVPFVWAEHEAPYDFARYSSYGIRHLLEKSSFEVVKVEKSTNYMEAIFQIWIAYIYQHLFPNNKILRLLMTPVFIAPITLCALVFSAVFPKNDSLYLSNIVVAKKKL